MSEEKKLYTYRGPVFYFGKVVADNWSSQTYASSQKKATSNLIYQFKHKMGYIQDVRVTLGGQPKLEA